MGTFLMVMTQTLMLLTTPQRLTTKQQSFSHTSVTPKATCFILAQISFWSRKIKRFKLLQNVPKFSPVL